MNTDEDEFDSYVIRSKRIAKDIIHAGVWLLFRQPNNFFTIFYDGPSLSPVIMTI